MNLFPEEKAKFDKKNPLADRMRPQDLDEFLGQEHILKKGSVLRNALEKGEIQSLILWGPPGTGKTTLAFIIAKMIKAHFVPFSAVVSGIKEIKGIMIQAKKQKELYGRKTILFVDEVHRFNKAQQD
ncbi:MAG: AAA family ATPase, partial [Candidatus Zixiibacteriota bacterium]